MNEFGEFLYTLRKEKGMTQAELAAALGVTNKAVSKWETGEAMPETSQLIPISRIFGVSVDELLAGQRNPTPNEDDREKMQDFIEGHIFTRGKDDGEKTALDKIGGAVCAAIVLLGVTAYLFLGVIAELWHPYWVIIPASALASGIAGIAFDLCNRQKKAAKIAHGENPYTGGACGIIMLCGIITYLCLGAFGNLWHPYWVIIPVCGLACAIVGAIGGIFINKK